MFSVGQAVGGILTILLISALWEWVFFKRVFDNPLKGKSLAVLAGYLTASVLYGFGAADGGPFNPSGFLVYLLGGAVIGFFFIRRGIALREERGMSEGDVFE